MSTKFGEVGLVVSRVWVGSSNIFESDLKFVGDHDEENEAAGESRRQ